MSWPAEESIPTKYRPWPIMAIAVLLFLVGLGYAYDGATLATHTVLSLPVIVGFVTGTAVCIGLAWGIWSMQEWARVVLVWLCLLTIALSIAAVPFLLLTRPPGTMINTASLLPGILAIAASVVVLRYLGRAETRAVFSR